jgi:hypothetical protein
MDTPTNTQPLPLNVFAFTGQKYQVREMVAFFYKVSNTEEATRENHWIANLEILLVRFKEQQYLERALCNTLRLQWRVLLSNVNVAVEQFEESYSVNCAPMDLVSNPFIKRLYRLQQSAKLAQLYIDV